MREGNRVNYSPTAFISRLSDFTMAVRVYDFVCNVAIDPYSHSPGIGNVPEYLYQEYVSETSLSIVSPIASRR